MLQEFVNSISKMVDSKINEIHTTIPGKIVSYDCKTGLATVLPMMKFRMGDGTTVAYPQITGVPVIFPQSYGQQATVAYPIRTGDGCLIFVAEHSIEYWLYGQETDTDLSFDLTDAFCIVGLFQTGNPVVERACKENAVIVCTKDAEIVLKKGEATVNAANIILNGNTTIDGDLTVSGTVESKTANNEETEV